jgi:hypothetical protein
MNENEIKVKLNTLADYQAHKDLIDIDKRTLLDKETVPEEVQAMVTAGMKEISDVEMSFTKAFEENQREVAAQLVEIVIPDEIKAALAEIDRQRAEVKLAASKRDEEIRRHIQVAKVEIQAKIEAQTKDIYSAIANRKAEIEAEFAGKSEAVDENIRKLTEEIKADVKALGETVKAEHFQAVYVKGRVTWDTSKMDGYAVGHPEVLFMRKEGDPSVTLRRI